MIQSLFLDRKSRQICGNFPTIVQSKNHHRLGHFNTKIAPKAHQKDNYNYRAPHQSPALYVLHTVSKFFFKEHSYFHTFRFQEIFKKHSF